MWYTVITRRNIYEKEIGCFTRTHDGICIFRLYVLRDAQRVLEPVITKTPVIPANGIVPDCNFYLKAECLQKTGAFKLRGAYYKIAALSDEERARGVIACSAGNHAQGVAYASRDMGVQQARLSRT